MPSYDDAVCFLQGVTSTPPDVVAKIESLTQVPTPDPQSIIITTLMNYENETATVLQKLTGFKEPPQGLSQVFDSLAS